MKAMAPIDPRILDQAADWLMQLHGNAASDTDREACARWRQLSPEHARAWARAEMLMNKLGGLPPLLAMPSLDRPSNPARRAAIGKLALLLAVTPIGFAGWRLIEVQDWTADHRTAVGQRRELALADGTQLHLNTASAVDIRFDAEQRLIYLREGEILIRTAPDTATTYRPLRVQTAQGRLEALGTFFSVRQEAGRSHLAVIEGAVRIEPRDSIASQEIIRAGQQGFFSAHSIAPITAGNETDLAWTEGMLMADNMRLGDFVTELARYRGGFMRCDPAVADIRVSGAFPLSDTDRALTMLVATYPVTATTRLRGYWVTICGITRR
ncbi:MAG: Fe2+-dicitrate sensor [Verrucomicrobiaceae bacterium]|nr:Fe2+-dicitrate sensor [Verrucomicrobiaceae bacterium]